MDAFYAATVELGISDRVVTFTLSDFGRTLAAVRRPAARSAPTTAGAATTSSSATRSRAATSTACPNGRPARSSRTSSWAGPTTSPSDDRGRWIPTTSVDQYGGTLARWFGVSALDLPVVLPLIANFSPTTLGFLTPGRAATPGAVRVIALAPSGSRCSRSSSSSVSGQRAVAETARQRVRGRRSADRQRKLRRDLAEGGVRVDRKRRVLRQRRGGSGRRSSSASRASTSRPPGIPAHVDRAVLVVDVDAAADAVERRRPAKRRRHFRAALDRRDARTAPFESSTVRSPSMRVASTRPKLVRTDDGPADVGERDRAVVADERARPCVACGDRDLAERAARVDLAARRRSASPSRCRRRRWRRPGRPHASTSPKLVLQVRRALRVARRGRRRSRWGRPPPGDVETSTPRTSCARRAVRPSDDDLAVRVLHAELARRCGVTRSNEPGRRRRASSRRPRRSTR